MGTKISKHSQNPPSSKPKQEFTIPKLSPEFKEGLMNFALDLYHALVRRDGNALVSPYSVVASLLLVHLGSREETEMQLRCALGMTRLSSDQIHDQFKQLFEFIKAKYSEQTAMANGLFYKQGLDILAKYISDNKHYYGIKLQKLDFAHNSEKSRKLINAWVEEQTRAKIKDFLQSEIELEMSFILLVNAFYFKASWAKKFDRKQTRKRDFNITKTFSVRVNMMQKKEYLRFMRDDELKCKGVEIPYEERGLSLNLLLPDEVEGLDEFDANLTVEDLNYLLETLRGKFPKKVILTLPRYKLTETCDLTEALSDLGIRNVFDQATSDLNGMVKGSTKAYVSDLIHTALIDVNEEGTEAAAATAMKTYDLIDTGPLRFTADHPFMFIITENETGTVMFIGRYTMPQENDAFDLVTHKFSNFVIRS